MSHALNCPSAARANELREGAHPTAEAYPSRTAAGPAPVDTADVGTMGPVLAVLADL